MQNFAGLCCGPAADDDDENLREMQNLYPELASISLSSTVLRCLASASGQLSVVVALAASMSWRCFMEWKTRCASAVASLRLFSIFFASLYTQYPGVEWRAWPGTARAKKNCTTGLLLIHRLAVACTARPPVDEPLSGFPEPGKKKEKKKESMETREGLFENHW
jgi:hypothetical protein